MDDEECIRQVARAMLEQLGYEVVCARDGQEAIDIYLREKTAGSPFHVIIMDLTVSGGMGGVAAMRKLTGIDPDARVIVSSGYAEDPVLANFKKYGFKGVVAKPYRVKDLCQAVRRAMASPSSVPE